MNAGWEPKRVIGVGVVAGIFAGMAMAMVMMLYGWWSATRSAWDAPEAIWAWVAGIDNFARNNPGENIDSVVLGMAGHMMNSMIVGVVFVAIAVALRLRDWITPIMLGLVVALGMWLIMRYAVLPANDPEGTLFTEGIVSPDWVWVVGHAAYGMVAGAVYAVAVNRVPLGDRFTDRGDRTRIPGA